MAFQGFKKIVPSDTPNITEDTSNSTTTEELDPQDLIGVKKFQITSFDSPKEEIKNSFQGVNIEDLEAVGIKTIELLKLASNSVVEKTRYNLPLLDSIPILFILKNLNAEKIKDNTYMVKGQPIAIKESENKWYNTNFRVGGSKSISLIKHLTARSENMNYEQERENDKVLFLSACKQLTLIQKTLQESNDLNFVGNSQKESTSNLEQPITITEKKSESVSNKISESDLKIENSEFKTNEIKTSNINEKEPELQSKSNDGKIQNSKINWKELKEQLNQVPLDMVMGLIGASDNEDGIAGQWKIWATGHNVKVTGNMWMNWNTNKGGTGGISLLTNYICFKNGWNEKDFEIYKVASNQAIKMMMDAFSKDIEYNLIDYSSSNTPTYKEPFCMPLIIPEQINSVKNYLVKERMIPEWIVKKQIDKGLLFAGYPSDWKIDPALKAPEKLSHEKVWAVFLAINGNAAEMRAIERTDQYAKMLAKGSDKDIGGFLIKAEKNVSEKTVSACEASIDAMSHHAMFPGRITMSCMGVNFKLAKTAAIDAVDRDYKFRLSFDNDLAGNEATVSFKEAMIDELGEEAYNKIYSENKIGYFELGMMCLEECIKNNKTFYFDVKNNETGMKAVKMFQTELFKSHDKTEINKLIANGKIKYINIAPEYRMITNVQEQAKETFSLLTSGKPYYIVLKQPDDENEEKPEVAKTRLAFEEEIERLAGNRMQEMVDKGLVLYSKKAVAKDWNEFFKYKMEDPEFAQKMRSNEMEFQKSTTPDVKSRKNKK